MSCKIMCPLILVCLIGAANPLYRSSAAMSLASQGAQNSASAPQFISAEQLKAKLARDEAVTIIDVRDTQSYLNSNKIKGSIYIKLRRLAYRLSIPPLKDIPRDRQVVTYCACPHDEASIRAAQMILDAGFKRVQVLQGGWQMWLKVNGQTDPRPRA
jgi:rhodanese-related sulfurtransferase